MLEEIDEFRSAQDLFEELRGRGEDVGLTTVYRTLQSLADAGGPPLEIFGRCATCAG